MALSSSLFHLLILKAARIKEAIIKLRDDPGLYEELVANARKAYGERYSWEIMERRLLTLYQELVGEVGQRKKRGHNSEEK